MQPRILLVSIFISIPLLIFSQDKENIDSISITKGFGFKIYSGTIIPHAKPLIPLKKEIIKAFELSYIIKKVNSKSWYKYYNYPEVGVSYMFMDLGYNDALGYSHCIYPYIVFPSTKKESPLILNFKVAIGLAYITKTYNSISNPMNVAVSSPLNLYTSLGINIDYRLSRKIWVSIGVNGSHFSNGSMKKPNYGLNILSGSLGMNYNINKSNRTISSTNLTINKSRWLASLSAGIKETGNPGGSKYGIGSFSIEYSKPIKKIVRYGAAVDYMFDGSTLKHFELDSVKYQSQLQASKLGATIMCEMSFYRLSAFANLGVYIYNHDKQNCSVYQRVGLRYRLSTLLYTQIALKTHMNIADYIELGILISIRKPRQ